MMLVRFKVGRNPHTRSVLCNPFLVLTIFHGQCAAVQISAAQVLTGFDSQGKIICVDKHVRVVEFRNNALHRDILSREEAT